MAKDDGGVHTPRDGEREKSANYRIGNVGLLLPVFSLGNKLLWSSISLATLFAVVLYASLLASLISSLVSHRSDHQSPLASWRLTAYKVGLTVLLMFCASSGHLGKKERSGCRFLE